MGRHHSHTLAHRPQTTRNQCVKKCRQKSETLNPLGERQRSRSLYRQYKGEVPSTRVVWGHASHTVTGRPVAFLPQRVSPENHPKQMATHKFRGILRAS